MIKHANQPLVSIIIPCYNQGIYLHQTLKSVFRQTYVNYEVIIINDGSNCKKTLRVLNTLTCAKTTVHNIINSGVSAARNYGVILSKGKYILPLDADDLIGPDYLSKAIPVLENNSSVGIVYSHGSFFGAKAGPMLNVKYSIGQILYANMIFCSGLFRKTDWASVSGYKTEMVYCFEDYDFWLSIISLGREVVCLPDCHFYYRIKRKSRSIVTAEQALSMQLKILEHHKKLYIDNLEEFLTIVFKEKNHNERIFNIFLSRLNPFIMNVIGRLFQFFGLHFFK